MADLDAWAASMVGVPFREHGRDRSGVDCWGLIVLAHREVFGIRLPDYGGEYARAVPCASLADLIERERSAWWLEVEEPAPGDVVLLRIHGRPVHCGLVIGGGRMLHAHEGTETCVERYGSLAWKPKVAGFWRHELRC